MTDKPMTVGEENQFHFNPSQENYQQLRKLFDLLGVDYDISWDETTDAFYDYINDICIKFRPVGSKEERGDSE